MQNHNTTMSDAATLTENELFEEFKNSEIVEYTSRGREQFRVSASDLLEPCCDFIEVDLRLEYIDHSSNSLSDHLETVEDELLGLLGNVRLARKAWEELKAERLILPEAPDFETTDRETYRAWERAANEAEKNPRYRQPESQEAA